MRFVRFDQDHLGLWIDDGIVDLTHRLGLKSDEPLMEYIKGDYDASEYVDADSDYERSEVEVNAPVGRPSKVIAAPLNYENHIEEALVDRDIDLDEWFTIEDKGYFLKAPSSVVGADNRVELPFSDRRVDHEIELAFITGEDVKDIDAEDAWDAIFGYTILLDLSVRGEQDRSNRKSYDTFTVVGPSVVTPNEVEAPQNLEMELQVNGETKQDANTRDMVYTCADIVEYASIGATIEAGDIVTTGTPEGVSELSDGDTIHAEIENVGEMTVDVTERDLRFEDIYVTKGGQD
jgi:2-keto-4-pentenoate hydratase/2-oxohepta-3-ene-1,7-dioic acid hydratase in catechol pathway